MVLFCDKLLASSRFFLYDINKSIQEVENAQLMIR